VPCYHPITGYRARAISPNGKRGIVFNPRYGFEDLPVSVPCGQCVGCRLERSRQWAIRCYHEASLHEENCFITLTYDDHHLPLSRSLDVRDFQRFIKRLRKKFGPKIRYYHCGEYGEHTRRPHYHACLFNFDFPDKVLHKIINDNKLYTSEIISELWPLGFCLIGNVTFQSAAYVARYIMKKINGNAAPDHYQYIDPETGEIHKLRPEYTTMSRRPGIGRGWLEKYAGDVFPGDFVVMDGKKMKLPRYYDRLLQEYDADAFQAIRDARVRAAKKHSENNTPARRKVREIVQNAKLKNLPRNLGE